MLTLDSPLESPYDGYDLQYFVIVLQLILVFLYNFENHTLLCNNHRTRKYTSYKNYHNAQSTRHLAMLQHSIETSRTELQILVLYGAC
jgi:hypothetical protein